MAKKYFNYSFQIKRTKKNAIILVIVVIAAITLFITWYNNRTEKAKLDKLSYRVVFGLNEFDAKDCDKAYRVNYKKNTCGTICIKKTSTSKKYLKNLLDDMKKNKFEFENETTKELGNKKWKYITTKNNEPVISYYSRDVDNQSYVIEYVDQTKYLDDDVKAECKNIIDKFSRTIKIKG